MMYAPLNMVGWPDWYFGNPVLCTKPRAQRWADGPVEHPLHQLVGRLVAGVVPEPEVLYEKHDFRRYQSGQPTVFSDTYIMTVPQYVYTWLILQFCGRSGPTGTLGNLVPPGGQNLEPRNLCTALVNMEKRRGAVLSISRVTRSGLTAV